jgi:hypothetical protein
VLPRWGCSQQPTPHLVSSSPTKAGLWRRGHEWHSEGPDGVAAEEDTSKDSGDDELSLSNIMLICLSKRQIARVVLQWHCSRHAGTGEVDGPRNVFRCLQRRSHYFGFRMTLDPMCASFDGILNITALDRFGQSEASRKRSPSKELALTSPSRT